MNAVRQNQTRRLPIFIKVLIFGTLVFAALAAVFFARAHFARRSVPGRIVRWFQGEGGAKQTVNDLVDDIRNKPGLAQLQPWSMETLARFRSGQVRTNGRSDFWPGRAIRLAAQERPAFIAQEWGTTNSWGNEEPQIGVLVSEDGQPLCVTISWYDYGVMAGAPDYHLTFDPPYHDEAKPGVFVIHGSK